jgi:UDPglucose 6-dehydrogenase
VRVHDPEAIENARTAVPSLDYIAEVSKAVEGSDLVLHLTEWQQYRDLDPQPLAHLAREPRVLDARNVLDVDLWRRGGWAVRALGRPLR